MRQPRPSRMEDAISRYRGMATLVAVPALLICAVLMLLPRSSSTLDDFSRSRPFSRSSYESASGDGKGVVSERYAVVVDAGSTGSRVHISKFHVTKDGNLELLNNKFDQLKPGLSSFADDPKAAAESLKPLLELAVATIPTPMQAYTPIMVGATAGLRLLPDGKADIILEEVRRWLASYPFTFANDDVKILSGVDEGAFAWLTLNYLLGKLGGPHHETVAAIDLGGGSVQEAFAMSPEEAAAAPKADYVTKLRGGGKTYNVYVYSYLGFGLMAGRHAVLSVDPNGPEDESHPCIHKGFTGQYEYGGESVAAIGHDSGASHDQCAATVLTAMRHQDSCDAPLLQCTFSGAWGGERVPAIFYVSSYFFDRALEAGIVDKPDAIDAVVSPKLFADRAQHACGLDLHSVTQHYPSVEDTHQPYFCLDLTYAYTLLTRGFKMKDDQHFTLVKRVEYRGELVEAAWPLGAAINMLG